VRRSEAPEVALAAETRPSHQDRQGKNLALGKESRTTGLARRTRGRFHSDRLIRSSSDLLPKQCYL
jgi:hypothetical protein